MSKIELPKLTDAQIEEIQSLYASGETLNAIQAKTGVRYSAVWFFAVNKGIPAEPDHPECRTDRWRRARAAQLMAAR